MDNTFGDANRMARMNYPSTKIQIKTQYLNQLQKRKTAIEELNLLSPPLNLLLMHHPLGPIIHPMMQAGWIE